MALPPGPVVVLTREPEDNLELGRQLAERGVPVLEIPCVATKFLVPPAPLPHECGAVAFLSRRGVAGLVRLAGWERFLSAVPVAAVGRATAAALAAVGIRVALVADPPTGEVLATKLLERVHKGASWTVAVVRGTQSVGAFDEVLTRAGVTVRSVEVYENVEPEIPALAPRPVAAAFVASPSAARRLLAYQP